MALCFLQLPIVFPSEVQADGEDMVDFVDSTIVSSLPSKRLTPAKAEVKLLPTIQLKCGGNLCLQLALEMDEGFKVNTEAPSAWQLWAEGMNELRLNSNLSGVKLFRNCLYIHVINPCHFSEYVIYNKLSTACISGQCYIYTVKPHYLEL